MYTMDFEKALQFYIDNQAKLVTKHKGKVLIIRNEGVVGVYDTVAEAYSDGIIKYGLGNFAIQPVNEGPESYTAVFHSPGIVSF